MAFSSRFFFVAAFCAIFLTGGRSARAQITADYGPATGGAIPDNTAAGFSSTINLAALANVSSLNGVTIRGLNHTWAGDLIATLTHAGVTVDLFRQPNGVNESTNLNGNYTFVPGGANFATALQGLGDNATLPGGTYAPSGTFGSFSGVTAAGDWTLKIADVGLQDTGAYSDWSFNLTSVPPPRGTGGAIPDDTPAGFFSDIVVGNAGAATIASFQSVSIFSLTHSLVGDLTASLEHVETGTRVDLFNRIGRVSDDQFDFGDDSNFAGSYTFTDGGASLADQAAAGNSSYDVPGGTYARSTSQVPGKSDPDPLSVFAGESANGTWRLRIVDGSGGDIGSFAAWDFSASFAAVPEPGTLGLLLPLAGAGLGVFTFRRGQNKNAFRRNNTKELV